MSESDPLAWQELSSGSPEAEGLPKLAGPGFRESHRLSYQGCRRQLRVNKKTLGRATYTH